MISIHSLHTEGDDVPIPRAYGKIDFNPLPPHGGRQTARHGPMRNTTFQSTPSTRRETVATCKAFDLHDHFNPLPPHGGRLTGKRPVSQTASFQSTPSTRRETSRRHAVSSRLTYFNPLPPHGGRRIPASNRVDMDSISIHSLHTEGDCTSCPDNRSISIISIHSLHTEGDRSLFRRTVGKAVISIHSLHTEGDERLESIFPSLGNFNPLPPHGGRRSPSNCDIAQWIFQSTPSTRRETNENQFTGEFLAFQSTPSTRRETIDLTAEDLHWYISIHSLHTEGDNSFC